MPTPQLLVTLSIVLSFVYLSALAIAAIGAALRIGGRRDDTAQNHDALAVSRFTIPVSVIVPALNDTAGASTTMDALLALNYPEFEVIVVLDNAPAEQLDAFVRRWKLEAREFFYRRTITTAPVRRIYRHATNPRLIVVDKTPGGYSDALNCGVNIARYRYITSVPPHITFDEDALLRVMSAPLQDPANVLGASNHVDRGANAGRAGSDTRHLPDTGLWNRVSGLFERLGSLRSFMNNRLAWRHLRSGLGPSGAVAVWRRDSVVQMNGFSLAAADANLEMMLRLQTTAAATNAARFHRGGEIFGHLPPQPVREVLRAAGQHQVAALQTLWACLRVGGRGFGLKAVAHFIEFELLTPLIQTWAVGATLAGMALGWYDWSHFVLVALLLSFGNSAVTAAAILLRGAASGAPVAIELKQLLLVGPLEFLLYRPALAAARILAGGRFLATGLAGRQR